MSTTDRITVPGGYVEDFRAAIVHELADTAGYVLDERKTAAKQAADRDPRADLTAADLPGHMRLVANDARLFAHVGHEGAEPVEVDVDGDGTLAHVFETMAREIVGPRLARELGYGPMDQVDGINELIERLSWSANRAAECHAALERRRDADRDGGQV